MSIGYILPLLLAILLASIPVALPTTFTLAAALGSLALSKRGVLITRLSALHDIASMTYTLNMLIKKIEMMALLVIGFLLTRHRPLTPMLMVLILFLNDFLTMSIATDRTGFSPCPNC
jgi:H+-transporting ATPase